MAIIRFDDVVMDPASLKVTKAGQDVELEPKSFRVLEFLARNPGRVVKKEELLQEVWNGVAVTDNALTRVIAQIRKSLGDDAKQSRYIETVPTVGYRFLPVIEAEPQAVPPPAPPEATSAPEKVSWFRRLLVPAGALLAIGISYLHQRGPQQDPIPALRSIQLTSSAGLDSHPTFSPDGTSLAYASDRTGAFELYMKTAGFDGGKEMQITHDGNQNVEPAWSPDGKFIAFHSVKERGIFVLPPLGGTRFKVADFGSQPAWGKDSRRIVFQSAPLVSFSIPEIAPSTPSTIWMATVGSDAPPKQLTKPNQPRGRHSSPVFSPEGRHVVFVAHNRPQAELWELELASGKLTKIETGLPYAYSPQFTPDGSGIFYFGASAPDSVGLYALGIDKDSRAVIRKAERILQFDFNVPRDLAIGPETRRLAYTVSSVSSNLWKWTPKGGEQPLTSETSNRITFPSFSPDGSKLAYAVRPRGTLADIWVSDSDGKNAQQITGGRTQDTMPNWAPDGRSLYYASNRGEKPGIWQYSLDRSTTKKIVDFADWKVMGKVSPNGREIVYHRGDEDSLALWKTDLTTLKETELARAGESLGFPVWSRDGSFVVAELRKGEDTHLAIVPATGGEVRQITDRPGQAWPWSFTPGGKQIVFSAHWEGIWNVYTIGVNGGAVRQVTKNTLARIFLRYPAWSPKEELVVYERNETKGNIFVAEPAASGVNNK